MRRVFLRGEVNEPQTFEVAASAGSVGVIVLW
jgi:hypothetical protein